MSNELKRRTFISSTAVGAACLHSLLQPGKTAQAMTIQSLCQGKTKTRVGRVYLGHPHPGWPMATVDLEQDQRQYEAEFPKLQSELQDIEFIDGGLVSSEEQLSAAMETFRNAQVDGVLAIQLTMGIGGYLNKFLELKVPEVVFALPYSGHEWHTIASMQKRGDKIEMLPSSDFRDLVTAVRPFRALHRLHEAKILCVRGGEPDTAYNNLIKEKFGTEIKVIGLERLAELYKAVDAAEVKQDADRWINEAEKIVEPTPEEINNASRMYLAMVKLLEEEQAELITMDCLGMGLRQRGMEYPCLGFSRLCSMGLGGVCEADLKSSMTHLIFQYLTGKPGFVTDPVFDMSNNTIIHAHCVSPLQMDGPQGEQCAYIIRNHLEDAQGVSLFVRMRLGQKVTMARLIGSDIMLFSTAEIVDTPHVDRGCRTKIATRVNNPQRILDNWSCGLHRVVFYGDHTADLNRFCRFTDVKVLNEEEENLRDIPGLEWQPYVHA